MNPSRILQTIAGIVPAVSVLAIPVSAIALTAGNAQAGGQAFEYELIVVEPQWDGSSGFSIFSKVSDDGVAHGTSTVRIPAPNGYRIIEETITWSQNEGYRVRPGLAAFNNRGDEVISSPNGQWLTIEFADGTSETIFTFPGDVAIGASVITENGLVAGCSVGQGQISQGTTCTGYFWTLDRGGVPLRDTGLVPAAVNIRSANANGEMVGISGNGLFANNQAFYFDSRTDEHIPLHPLLVSKGTSGVLSSAEDINDHGVVVGSRNTGFNGNIRGFMWSRDDGVQLLPVDLSAPRAINNEGVIVGQSLRYIPGEGVANLNDLADTGTFTIAQARDISDNGVIVGWGRRQGSSIWTAFMLVPLNGCPADLTGDGNLDFFDVSAFLNAFSAQDPIADFNADGSIDFFDVSDYLQAFNAGCP